MINDDLALVASDRSIEAPRLSTPEATIIRNLTKMRLMLNELLTYAKLGFKEFKAQWWSQETKEQARKIFDNSDTRAPSIPEEVIAQAKSELPPPPPQWLNPRIKSTLIFGPEALASDHGFHSLLRVR